MRKLIEAVERVIRSGRFAAFLLFTFCLVDGTMVAALLTPTSAPGVGALVEELKVWCFGYDPATGRVEWAYVAGMLGQFALLAAVVASAWWRPLSRVLSDRRSMGASLAASVLFVAATGTALGAMTSARASAAGLPFPAERIRTALPAPRFTLTDQEGRAFRSDSTRGRVVLLTGVYSRCGFTCPMILRGAREALRPLPPDERARVDVVAITLDPSHDTPERLAEMARSHNISAPGFRLLTGPAPVVERTLDELSIARTRNAQTGVIDHANVYVLLDREGRVAYRLSPNERQRAWVVSALRALLRG